MSENNSDTDNIEDRLAKVTNEEETQRKERKLIEAYKECDRFFIDPDLDTSSFVSYRAGYEAYVSPQGRKVVWEDYSLKVADCYRHIQLYFMAANREEIKRSKAKLDRIKAGLDAIMDHLNRLDAFYESHPEFCQKSDPDEELDHDYDDENGEWKRGRIKRR